MSSATAHWFLTDEEYYSITEDYAFPCASAKLIRREIDEGNKFPFPACEECPADEQLPRNFHDALQRHKHGIVYDFASAGSLVYADVDDSNPTHVQETRALQGHNQQTLESPSAASQAALDAFITHFVAHEDFQKHWQRGPFDAHGHLIQDPHLIQKAKTHCIKTWLNRSVVYPKTVNARIVDYMAGPGGHPHAPELLNIISEQDHLRNQRPVLILVDMIDSLQEPACGAKRGWAVGYDIVTNTLLIKPFFSDATHHPLGSSWKDFATDDGVSGRWSPLEFVHAYLQLTHKVTTTQQQSINPRGAFRIFVHTLALRTIVQLWDGLIAPHTSSPSSSSTLKSTAKEAYSSLKHYLKRIPFPAATKEPTKQGKGPAEEPRHAQPFERLQWDLDAMEDYVRGMAVEARERGDEGLVRKVRSVWETVYKAVEGLNGEMRGGR